MNRLFNLFTKLIIFGIFFHAWRLIIIIDSLPGLNEIGIAKFSYVYMLLGVCSLFSDRFFYSGQKTQDKKAYLFTSELLMVTWFLTLVTPLLEYAYTMRYNFNITILGIVLVIVGTIIRGMGIRTLGKFFSRHIETWDNHEMINEGIYKYIRHPAYAGNVFQIIGFPLVLNAYYTLILSVITIGVFLVRINTEEKFLKDKFPNYENYMKETKRILPGIW